MLAFAPNETSASRKFGQCRAGIVLPQIKRIGKCYPAQHSRGGTRDGWRSAGAGAMVGRAYRRQADVRYALSSDLMKSIAAAPVARISQPYATETHQEAK